MLTRLLLKETVFLVDYSLRFFPSLFKVSFQFSYCQVVVFFEFVHFSCPVSSLLCLHTVVVVFESLHFSIVQGVFFVEFFFVKFSCFCEFVSSYNVQVSDCVNVFFLAVGVKFVQILDFFNVIFVHFRLVLVCGF